MQLIPPGSTEYMVMATHCVTIRRARFQIYYLFTEIDAFALVALREPISVRHQNIFGVNASVPWLPMAKFNVLTYNLNANWILCRMVNCQKLGCELPGTAQMSRRRCCYWIQLTRAPGRASEFHISCELQLSTKIMSIHFVIRTHWFFVLLVLRSGPTSGYKS